MATVATTINAVFTNKRTSAKGPFNSYDVKTSAGKKFQTTKDELGQKAEQLKGQPVTIEYEETQRGEYTNYTIKSIEPVAAETGAVSNTHESPRQDDRQERIERQSARRDAIAFASLGLVEIQGVQDLYALADEFARYAKEGQQVPEEEPQY